MAGIPTDHPDPHKGGLYRSHVATGEPVVTPLVGVWQHARNRFFIKNSQTLPTLCAKKPTAARQ